MTLLAADVYRDYELPGVPASGPNQPTKAEVRAWGTFLESLLNGSAAGLAYTTLVALNANLVPGNSTTAIVFADSTPALNGLYFKTGSTGVGFWVRIGDLPNSIVRLTVTGGTGNAIVATATETPTAPGSKLYLLTPAANNSGPATIAVNGGSAVAIKTALGSALVTGSLLADSQVLMAWAVDHYQLLISVPVDATGILNDAIAARDAASGYATSASGYATAAASSASALGNQVHQYDTRALAAAATIPGGVAGVQTFGLAAIGDGGGNRYIHASGSTTGGFQSADGQWWKLISKFQFGDGAFSTDDCCVLANRGLTPVSGALNSHAFRDETIATQKVGATFTGTGSGTNLTASSVTGFIAVDPTGSLGSAITGTGVPGSTRILSQTSGTPGGAGVYVTNNPTTSSGNAITATIFSGYSCVDAAVTINGVATTAMNHVRAYQARPIYNSTGTINEFAGLWVGLTVAAGLAAELYGVHVINANYSGGAGTNQYGFYADTLSGATNNYFLFGGSNPSVLNGRLYVGGRLNQLSAETANIQFTGNTQQGLLFSDTVAAAGNGSHCAFYRNNSSVGFISSSLTTTTYSTTCDEDLKIFLGNYDHQEAIRIIRADPVRDYQRVEDGSYHVGWGAQTSHKVSQDLATPGTGTIGDADWTPWGMDYGRRAPYLWAAAGYLLDELDASKIREAALVSRLDALEKRLAAMEAALP